MVLGHDLRRMGQRERARFRGETIGFVFQQFNLLPALTAAENVAVPLLINGEPRRAALERARRRCSSGSAWASGTQSLPVAALAAASSSVSRSRARWCTSRS